MTPLSNTGVPKFFNVAYEGHHYLYSVTFSSSLTILTFMMHFPATLDELKHHNVLFFHTFGFLYVLFMMPDRYSVFWSHILLF